MALPVAFVLILVAIKNAVVKDDNSDNFQSQIIEAVYPNASYTALSFQDYVTALQATRRCVERIDDPDTGKSSFWITGIPDQGYVRTMLLYRWLEK